MSATLRRSGSIVRDAFRKVATTVRSQLVAASRYMRAVRHYYGEALLVGIAAAARCLRWIVYRICVPMLCVFVSTAAAWSFAVATNDYMQGKPLLVGWLTALKAGAFGALAIASAVIGWTPVSGCHRVNVLHSTAIATRTVAPRLLLIFAVGAVTVEAMNLVDHLWPIRPGPLTAIALLAVAWSLWGSRQDQPVAPQPPSDPLAPPMSFRQIDRVK